MASNTNNMSLEERQRMHRKEHHRKVEKRRRETINGHFQQIASIVPNCEKNDNKGRILQRAAEYIRQLQENETSLVHKYALEKLVTDQAISELNTKVQELKHQIDQARKENAKLKRKVQLQARLQ